VCVCVCECVCVCVCVCERTRTFVFVRVCACVDVWCMQIWLNADENASTHTVKKTCAFFSLDEDRIYPSGYSIPTRVYVSLFWFSNLAQKN